MTSHSKIAQFYWECIGRFNYVNYGRNKSNTETCIGLITKIQFSIMNILYIYTHNFYEFYSIALKVTKLGGNTLP